MKAREVHVTVISELILIINDGVTVGDKVIKKVTDKDINEIVKETINEMDYDFTSNNPSVYISDSEIDHYEIPEQFKIYA